MIGWPLILIVVGALILLASARQELRRDARPVTALKTFAFPADLGGDDRLRRGRHCYLYRRLELVRQPLKL